MKVLKRDGIYIELVEKGDKTTEPKFEKVFLRDDEYGRAIQVLVFACTDAMLVNKKNRSIYLARRASKPTQGLWWLIGGRKNAGETDLDSIVRCFKRETTLSLNKNRFQKICDSEVIWKDG